MVRGQEREMGESVSNTGRGCYFRTNTHGKGINPSLSSPKVQTQSRMDSLSVVDKQFRIKVTPDSKPCVAQVGCMLKP